MKEKVKYVLQERQELYWNCARIKRLFDSFVCILHVFVITKSRVLYNIEGNECCLTCIDIEAEIVSSYVHI